MFVQKEYDENDARAKKKFIELFYKCDKYKGLTLVEPTDKYTVDFYVYNGDRHIANVEVEVKKPWKQHAFTFNDVQILPRKRKFWEDTNLNKGKKTLFVMFNMSLSNHLVILSETMENIFSKGNTRNSYRDWETDRKSTRLNSSHSGESRMPSSA